MKTRTLSFFLLIAFISVLFSCQKDNTPEDIVSPPQLPETTYDYKDIHSAREVLFSSTIAGINNEKATLGRVLFYDKHLSKNNSVSCGSCHKQHLAFADGLQFSTGLNGKKTTRNSMATTNAGLQFSFFWDNRANDLEEQVMMPIENHIEMGVEKLSSIPPKLAELDYYAPLFEKAYGSPEITESRISKALANFLESMISMNSKFDQGAVVNYDNLSPLENMGRELFNGIAGCRSCHNSHTLGGWGSANIGLDIEYADKGIGFGNFKIPSLKNIALTAPYMHDGRFETLEEVIDHYNEGVKNHPSLSWQLRSIVNGSIEPRRLNLDNLEKEALIAFLETLTDPGFLADDKYSDPFLK